MEKLKKSFIGISLGREYTEDFTDLIKYIQTEFPEITTVNPETSHITLYYLHRQNASAIEEILEIIQNNKSILSNEIININEFGLFNSDINNLPRIIYLKVDATQRFFDFHNQISRELNKFNPADTKQFIPHITLGRIKDDTKAHLFNNRKHELNEYINQKVNWEFTISSIDLYAKKDDDINTIHQKIAGVNI